MALGNGGGPTTEASFEGECAECASGIEPGDLITKTDDGWVCEDCAYPDDHAVTRPQQPRAHRFEGTDLDDMGY